MVDGRLHMTLVLGVTAAALNGCGTAEQVFLLEQICNPETPYAYGDAVCTVSGDAELTTALTSDSTAVHFGPKSGELRILLYALGAAGQTRWSLDALAASSRSEGSTLYRSISWGSCGSSCPSDPEDVEAPLSQDFQWAAVVADLPGTSNVASQVDALLTLRGADIDLIDIRMPGYDPSYYYY
jgi:hypothetical protein